MKDQIKVWVAPRKGQAAVYQVVARLNGADLPIARPQTNWSPAKGYALVMDVGTPSAFRGPDAREAATEAAHEAVARMKALGWSVEFAGNLDRQF